MEPARPPLKRRASADLPQGTHAKRNRGDDEDAILRHSRRSHHAFYNLPAAAADKILSYLVPEPFELSEELTLENGLHGQDWMDFVTRRSSLLALSLTSRD